MCVNSVCLVCTMNNHSFQLPTHTVTHHSPSPFSLIPIVIDQSFSTSSIYEHTASAFASSHSSFSRISSIALRYSVSTCWLFEICVRYASVKVSSRSLVVPNDAVVAHTHTHTHTHTYTHTHARVFVRVHKLLCQPIHPSSISKERGSSPSLRTRGNK